MFCYRSRIESICCQEFRQKGATDQQNGAVNQITSPSDEAKKLINELKSQAGLPSVVTAPNEAQSSSGAIFLADNEQSRESEEKSSPPEETESKTGRIRVQINRAKAQAVKTEVGPVIKKNDEEQEIEYKPHNQGGYAVSRDKLNKINARKGAGADRTAISYLPNQKRVAIR